MKKITGRLLFWTLFITASISGLIFSVKNFSKALPIINIDIKMDRTEAMKKAADLAQKYNWGPQHFDQATMFVTDSTTQMFIELEAGGRKAIDQMLEKKLYALHTWQVRHFKESEVTESQIIFTPEGKAYGFLEILPEEKKGASLSDVRAKKIADSSAIQEWNINLNNYKLIESSSEIRTGGRTDHTFVYERSDEIIGEGRYRLKLVVGGDTLTQLLHFIKLPDDFSRRYTEMRAANNSIATAATVLMILLYLIGGCLIGLLFLFRSRYIIWRTPLFWSGILGFLQFAASINNIPTAWMSYDTALPAKDFLLSYLLQISIFALGIFFLGGIIFITAESLSRKAFGNHPQLWHLWSKENGASTAIAGRTFGGYLLPAIHLGISTAVYLIATKFFGWWWPSDILINPNILGTYLPWLPSVSSAFSAGFLEECLYRAVPLAGAMLLGKRFGHQKTWLTFAFILQAIIFGAAHANYPAQPAYARLLELIIPSFILGGVYIRYGLFPAIISHIMYDLSLMSLPLFIASIPGIWLYRIPVILIGAIPLLVVLLRRLQIGRFNQFSQQHYNAAWVAPSEVKVTKDIAQKSLLSVEKKTIHNKTTTILFIASLIGLGAWIGFTKFTQEAPRINISKTEALTIAQNELKKRNLYLNDEWQALPTLLSRYDAAPELNLWHTFIWQSDHQLYRKLIGTYLPAPQWVIKFVRFNGNISERSEEYRVAIDGNGKLYRFTHYVPEQQEGAHLSDAKARKLVHEYLKNHLHIQPESLNEIAAIPATKPNRTDWSFIFSNPQIYSLDKGQARITISIAGDTIIDTLYGIHVPEEWQREERKKQNIKKIINLICMLFLLFSLLIALLKKRSSRFSRRVAIISFIILALYSLFNVFNNWSAIISAFNTSEPFGHQLFMVAAITGIIILVRSGIFSLLFGLVYEYNATKSHTRRKKSLFNGFALGTVSIGLYSAFKFFLPATKPLWGNVEPFGLWLPGTSIILSNVVTYFIEVTIWIIILRAFENIVSSFAKNWLILIPLFLLFGIGIVGSLSFETIPMLLLVGTTLGFSLLIAYQFILQFDSSSLISAFAIFLSAELLQQAIFYMFPWAWFAYIIALLAILATSFFLIEKTNH